MNDKKSCANCGWTKHLCEAKGLRDQWLRNPRMWLSILPTEPGWYLWKIPESKYDSHPVVLYVRDYAGRLAIQNCTISGSQYEKGEWQGPIKPEEG